jgi:hypothetical protein
MGKANMPVMPLGPTLLAALTPAEHEVTLVDMFYGDEPDYDADWDLVAITVRTFKNRPSPGVAMNSFFSQLGMRKAFRQQFLNTSNRIK